MERKTITPMSIFSNGLNIALKNLPQLIVNFILFILTFWIPYINIGTFIGITSGIPLKLSKNEPLSYTEIFNPHYRKFFGEYFLLLGFRFLGVFMSIFFFVIPAYVLSFSWYIADLVFLDGKAGSIDSLKKSNEMMYGNKWSAFFGFFIFVAFIVVATSLIALIGRASSGLAVLLELVLVVLIVPIFMGMKSYIYRELSEE